MIEQYGDFITDWLRENDAKNTVLSTKSDIRHSDLFGFLLKDVIRYAPQRKSWYYYDGIRWSKDEGGAKTAELCKVVAGRLYDYAINDIDDSDKLQYINNARRWQDFNFRKRIIEDAKTTNPIDISDFDSNPYLINLQNGTFNLITGELKEHNADDLITKLAPVHFLQNSFLDRWDSFIMEIMSNDSDKAEFLQKALGYTLSGSTSEECMFILYGATTRNGKGTLMESIVNVLGDYAKAVKPESIAMAHKSSNSHSEDIARLQGVRLANISEPPKSMQLNSALVKALTGGDTINARYLNENSFDFKPQFKLFVNTNYLPKIDDATVFSSNRIHIIPFNKHFEIDEQDKTLKTQFRTEQAKSAIFSWLIEGYYKMLSCGLTPCKAIQDATNDYQQISEPIYCFLNTALVVDSTGRIPVFEARKQYKNWALAHNEREYTDREFSMKLSKYVTVKYCKFNGVSLRAIVL